MRKHNIATDNLESYEENGKTKWRIAVPKPLYTHRWLILNRYQCQCGHIFKRESDYVRHYRLAIDLEKYKVIGRDQIV